MSRVVRLIRSLRTATPVDASPAADSCGTVGEVLETLRAAVAGIGTTLDEETTCAELTRAVADRFGCSAAVVRVEGATVSGYGAIAGEADALPDVRWATAIARETVDSWAEAPACSPVGPTAPGLSRPALCVPVATGALRYGTLVCARERAPFTPTEARLLALLAERAASHLRHARDHAGVSRTAGDLQRALRAEPGRPHPNLDVATRYLPAGRRALVGGDWCETVRLNFGRTLLVVGDVMGHGVEAAVDMAAYRSDLRSLAAADLPPQRILRQLDDIAAAAPDRRPATCLIARVDPARGRVTLAGAGHLPPTVIGGRGGTVALPMPVGPPLGTGLGGYEPTTCALDETQTLLMFTDGLVERRGEDIDVSLERLARIRFRPGDGVEDILNTVLTGLGARHAEDDVAVLAARPRRDGTGSR
ncbi:PP2C family protein-serine/threonine phosphatase [Streptomyces griseorubiginosus]|uniref:PP2C family protein-serine/threonine phosphatase n=1 Tax=Streptomyces griseorubiginosus TaxID=67304 RepID=UPI001AD62C1C|nr:PP2C family protein-serine/threonine phosphatase [Streptomyces griseorubiginosus]MBO4254454.1 SpoIIE family protein phosphatase [Streptomyces griseorubiginosus]